MKAILLAAGRGTRISKRIADVPKCTLPVGNEPMIRRTVEMMLSLSIDPVVCVGYRKEKVYEALEGLPVAYYNNPFFDVTNSIGSLWFARRELDDHAVIMNGDVFVSVELLNRLLAEERPVVMLADRSRVEAGDYFFYLDDDQRIVKYGKGLPLEERSAEYVGLAKISKDFMPSFKGRLEELINSQQHNCWWEDVLYSYAESGTQAIETMDVDGDFWSEIDFIDDYERILRHVAEKSVSRNPVESAEVAR